MQLGEDQIQPGGNSGQITANARTIQPIDSGDNIRRLGVAAVCFILAGNADTISADGAVTLRDGDSSTVKNTCRSNSSHGTKEIAGSAAKISNETA